MSLIILLACADRALFRTLIATIKDKGRCPCPRCIVATDNLQFMGQEGDSAFRKEHARENNSEYQALVHDAREAIYSRGYVVNSEALHEAFRAQSWVPTIV